MRSRDIGSLRHVSDLVLGIGGAESNVAIGLRRLGIDTKWLGRVGDDPLGERVTREIRAEGVEVYGVVDPHAPTGLMLKERPTVSSTAVFYYRAGSAGSPLQPDDLTPDWIEGVELVHLSGVTVLLSDTARDCVLAAIGRARSAGVQVSFDVNYRSTLSPPDVAGPLLRKIAENADVVFGGTDELQLLYPDGDAGEAAERLIRGGCREVVLKKGADGAAVQGGEEVVESPGFTVDVIDTVGAGDAFVAGYLSGLLQRLELAGRLLRANACGAMLCMSPATGNPVRRWATWNGSASRERIRSCASPFPPPAPRARAFFCDVESERWVRQRQRIVCCLIAIARRCGPAKAVTVALAGRRRHLARGQWSVGR